MTAVSQGRWTPFAAHWSLRVAVAATVLALFVVIAVRPGFGHGWISSRAQYRGASSHPDYDVPIDHNSLRTAGEILHRAGGTYYVYVPPGAPVLLGNISGALRLWAVPAVPLAWNTHPDWVFSYRTRRLVPPGLRAVRVFVLGEGIRLVEVAR